MSKPTRRRLLEIRRNCDKHYMGGYENEMRQLCDALLALQRPDEEPACVWCATRIRALASPGRKA